MEDATATHGEFEETPDLMGLLEVQQTIAVEVTGAWQEAVAARERWRREHGED